MLRNLPACFIADCREYSPAVAAIRLLRASRVLGMPEVRRRLQANAAYRRHVAGIARTDPVFFLSHRHYLAAGLTPAQRAATAVHHYEHEVSAFDSGYFEAVYEQAGLTLWHAAFDGHRFDIRLMTGNDVLYEGGLSLVMHYDGSRIAVLSYSMVPSAIFVTEPSPRPATLFVTRKQLTFDHEYQKVFNKAFDRTTPGHLLFGALAGIALAQGLDRVVGILPAVHPAYSPDIEKHLKVAYTDFWESLAGRPASPFGHVIDVPMRLTPLDELEAKARKRAMARREHIRHVQEAAHALVQRHLRRPADRGGPAPREAGRIAPTAGATVIAS